MVCGADDGRCDSPRCENQVQDGDETDVDCGGATCATRCAPGERCVEDDGFGNFTVYASENCQDRTGANTVCSEVDGTCAEPSCFDDLPNQGETDRDCGGPCLDEGLRCAQGQGCALDIDCVLGSLEIGTAGSSGDPAGFVPIPALTLSDIMPSIELDDPVLSNHLEGACLDMLQGPCATDRSLVYRYRYARCGQTSGSCEVFEEYDSYSCSRDAEPARCAEEAGAQPPIETLECGFQRECDVVEKRFVYVPAPGDYECVQQACTLKAEARSYPYQLSNSSELDCSATRLVEPVLTLTSTECARSTPCAYGTKVVTTSECRPGSRSRQEVDTMVECTNAETGIDGNPCGPDQCRGVGGNARVESGRCRRDSRRFERDYAIERGLSRCEAGECALNWARVRTDTLGRSRSNTCDTTPEENAPPRNLSFPADHCDGSVCKDYRSYTCP
ncbi:MAG: hypothetical protein AAFX94_00335 [Myxococcota bacterium]